MNYCVGSVSMAAWVHTTGTEKFSKSKNMGFVCVRVRGGLSNTKTFKKYMMYIFQQLH